MTDSNISLYIQGVIGIQKCQESVLNRVSEMKQKIDKLEEGERKTITDSQSSQFLSKNKKVIKSILSEMETLEKVQQRLCDQFHEKNQLQKKIIIDSIRRQSKRFHNLIPQGAQQQAKLSSVTKSSIIIEPQQKKEDDKSQRNSEQQSEYQDLIFDLNSFLERSSKEPKIQMQQVIHTSQIPQDIQEPSQKFQIIQKEQQKNIDSQIILNELQQRKKYNKFIYQQKIRQSRAPFVIAGKVLSGILFVALILLIILCFIVYNVMVSLFGGL